MKHAQQYFNNHEAVNKLYFTSDNLAFFDEQNAKNHARNLDDDTISVMTREEVDEELEDITNDDWEDDPEFGLRDESDAE
jgi:hypothetical protein